MPAEINLSLFPRQVEALHTTANEILYGGGSGGGKATLTCSTANIAQAGYDSQDPDQVVEFRKKFGQYVITPFGQKLIDDVKVGDQVVNPDGTTGEIIQVHPVQRRPCYRIKFIDGAEVITADDHLWALKSSGRRTRRSVKSNVDVREIEDPQERFAQELSKRYRIFTTERLAERHARAQEEFDRGERPHWISVPLTEPVNFQGPTGKTTMLPPYALGVWLGDGSCSGSTPSYFKPVPEIAELMRQELRKIGDRLSERGKVGSYGFVGGNFYAGLKSVQLNGCRAWEKFIPQQYLYAPVDKRWELIQGLMDTDGYVDSQGNAQYCTTSERLRDDFQHLARSLGFAATAASKPEPSYTYKGEALTGRPAWDIYITGRNMSKLCRANPFKFDRRKEKQNECGRRIVSVEKLEGEFDTRCITVSNPNGLYLTNDFVVTHNSHLMRVAAVTWCYLIPNLQVYLVRRLSNDLYKNHMEGVHGFVNMLDPWVKSGFVQIIQPGTIRFNNGARIFLKHCQYEHNVSQFQGQEIHVLMIDELTHFTEPMYVFMRSRCRMVGIRVPSELKETFPRILCGSNPGSVGHNWVKAAFVDMTNKGERIVETTKQEGGMRRQFIPALFSDNPALMEEDPTYLDRLDGLGDPMLVRAMKEGDWGIVSGGMFDDVWNESAIVLPNFKIPSSWRLTRSFDWGEAKPFSVGWWAETGDEEVEVAPGIFRTFYPKSLIRFAEWYGWSGKPDVGCRMPATEIAHGILARESKMEIRGLVDKGPADSAIFGISEGSSIAERMQSVGVGWTKADKRPGSRVQGWSRMREMFVNSSAVPMQGPGLFCMKNCEHFIRTIPTLPRDEKINDDVNTKSEDHVADEVRYRVWKKSSSLSVVRTTGIM